MALLVLVVVSITNKLGREIKISQLHVQGNEEDSQTEQMALESLHILCHLLIFKSFICLARGYQHR